MFSVFVIGPPGAGKTSVLTSLHDVLTDGDVAHAVVEVEAVSLAHPPITDERSFEHLSSACRVYERAGYELLLVGATVTSADYLAAIIEAVAADEHLVVRLEADPLTLRRRIIAREPPEWSGLPRLLEAVDEIARASELLDGVNIVCSTEDASPLAVAGQIRAVRPDVLARNDE